ncbi:Peptidoglycan/LPS O-acetylase OafA/YrhL, contains acyltransferase and SGNH-hydrolase domains [Klenkia soli]|uniref:Peptidoglycan/LPS O-acetylase OafA/YrhL, contains acyltransferase and SGNH-hydrolase domains n=1 Tax=Klenkia soli TaxID=1052260 RepID=A0A1H0UTF3_9ACTN|nr:acyltransferase [Klenkia soli]SDP69497.1 Peptidoglycan/LPS O-acetylase OafA/YrhL, contains acyltransferase and SGNH-hydrolase domains [Klenkia soli]
MRPAPTSPDLLPRLTSLRIVAALAVAVFHLQGRDVVAIPGALADSWYVGVAFFFVLSGFVLAWGTRPGLPAGTFWRRRFARIWPSHLVMVGVAAVVPVVQTQRSLADAGWNILLLQGWSTGTTAFSMNAVAWSLSCEAFFYALFPLLVWAARRCPGWVRWSVAGAGLVLAVGAGLVVGGWAYHMPIFRLPEFVLGVVAGLAVRDGWRPAVPTWVVMPAVVVGLVVSLHVPDPVPDAPMAVLFLGVILWAQDRDRRDVPGWLRSRALVFAGEASFAFYLVHELVIVNLVGHLPGPGWLQAAVMLLLGAVAAVVLHLGVEKPANRWIRGGSRSRALVPVADVADPRPVS